MSSAPETLLPYGTVIAGAYKQPGGATDAVAPRTVVNGSPISAILEVQSTTQFPGAICWPSVTSAQRDSFNATQGMTIYNNTTGYYEVFSSGSAWEPLTEGSGGGVIPYYITTAGPIQMLVNSIYFLNSGAPTTLLLPLAATLGDVIEINTSNSNFTITQNAGQSIRVLNAVSTVGVGGSVASISGAGASIQIRFNSLIWVASPGFSGTYTIT